MKTFKNKNILLGVTGSIAAYKTLELIREFKKHGAVVKVMVTKTALKFIGIVSFESLSQEKVYKDLFAEGDNQIPLHIDLSQWADVIVIAPATANIISKAAHGIADDFVSTVILCAHEKVIFAPAMETGMLHNSIISENMDKLTKAGCSFITSEYGSLASGAVGDGRMASYDVIFKRVKSYFNKSKRSTILKGKKVLITVGRTEEKIDPVRYISNKSSGKMGMALAESMINLGADVRLVCGKIDVEIPGDCAVNKVTSVSEMYHAITKYYEFQDIVIMVAAVADYKVKKVRKGKIKTKGSLSLELIETTDILKSLGKKKDGQFLVGFALETSNDIVNGKKKTQG